MSAQDYSTFTNIGITHKRFSTLQLLQREIVKVIHESAKRRELARMLRLDTEQLCDCGISREEIIVALNAPLSQNAGFNLMSRRAQRARSA